MTAITFRGMRAELIDAVSNRNALYGRLMKKGNVQTQTGHEIAIAIDYPGTTTTSRVSGMEPFSIAETDDFTNAEYPWRKIITAIALSGSKIRQNSGKSAILDYVKSKVKHAMREHANVLSQDFYSDGVTYSNQIGGLQLLVAASANTVGGISGSTYSWWMNAVQSAAAPLDGGAALTVGATTFGRFLSGGFEAVKFGTEEPDLVVLAKDYWSYFEQSQAALVRYSGQDVAGGFTSLKYRKADVISDSTASGTPTTVGYGLNTDFISVVTLPGANMET
ncbi:MAG: phage major capsid protein, partial [Terriglobia bacterium]